MNDCVFCKIINKEIKADIVFESDKLIAINDINPQAPIHILIIPKIHISSLNNLNDYTIISEIFETINKLTKKLNIQENGYRVVVNCNKDGGQTIFHIHFHLLGGRFFKWPPG